MEASLMPYCKGAIALYKPSFDAETISKYNLWGQHPVMIVTAHFSETTFEYMVFPITSKIDKFCGYRIMINSSAVAEPGKMSVIRTDIMRCVDRRDLYSVFGYAPAELVDKCLKAFSWHIGISDEIPEYVREDPRRMEYLMAGMPNIVHEDSRIEGDIACHGFRPIIETGLPRMLPTREFKTGGPVKPGKGIITKSTTGEPIKPSTDETNQPIIGNLGQAMLDAAKKVIADDQFNPVSSTQTETVTEEGMASKDPVKPTSVAAEPTTEVIAKKLPAKSDKNDSKKTIREEMESVTLPEPINAGGTATIVQRYIRRSRISVAEANFDLSKEMIDRIKAMPIDSRKDIYSGAMTEINMQKKFKLSKYSAHKLRLAIIKYITVGIERLGQDMRKFQKDCKFLINDEDILMFRCMLPYEMRHARVGLTFYSELVESKYGINFEKDTITGMIQAELKKLGKPMPNF